MRRLKAGLILAWLLAASGCAHLQPSPQTGGDWATWDDLPARYRFYPGDEIDIKLLHAPELSDRVIVAPDGSIQLELLGPVRAEGRTAEELEAELHRLYAKELRQPEVSVAPRLYGSEAFYIAGEVNNPGALRLTPRLSLLKAVIAAGGVKDTANLDQVILIRRGGQEKPMLKLIDLRGIMEGRRPEDDLLLQRFDLVFVARSGIAEADLRSKQYVRDLLPIDPGLWFGYFPVM